MKNNNLHKDLQLLLHNALEMYGVIIPIEEDLTKMLLNYLTICKKLLQPLPRMVYISPILEKKLQTHVKKNEIELLRKMFESGKDVNFFQSKRLFQTSFHDHMLYEWNIYHFHLALALDKKTKFIKQSNQLLFVYAQNEKAIFLDTDLHKTGIFADVKWLEILHDYYPETLEKYKDLQILDVYPPVNAEERQDLWNKGYTLGMTKVRDTIYLSEGIGRTTSGHSILVVKQANEIQRWLHTVSEQFVQYSQMICKYFKIIENEFLPKLIFGQKTFEIIDEKTKINLLTYPQIFTMN